LAAGFGVCVYIAKLFIESEMLYEYSSPKRIAFLAIRVKQFSNMEIAANLNFTIRLPLLEDLLFDLGQFKGVSKWLFFRNATLSLRDFHLG